MTTPPLSLIVAVAQNRTIGRDNQLPWHLSSDLQRFKKITMGHPIIMGRKTYQSIGRPLPGRQNIIITRQPQLAYDGCTMATSLQNALTQTHPSSQQAFIIGGASLFQEGLHIAQTIYLTRVEAHIKGDVHFPPFPTSTWECTHQEPHPADEKNNLPTTFQIWKTLPKK